MNRRAIVRNPPLPQELLERMAGVLRVLAHPQRLRIVEFLSERGSAAVHEITAQLDLPQASVSGHLGKMRQTGLLRAERQGKEIRYAIQEPNALTILDCIRRKAGRE